MKFNWGVGITITIILFTLLSLLFLYFAFNQEVNLVRDDYYEAEIQFNKKLETIKRTPKLFGNVNTKLIPKYISIKFPSEIDFTKTSGTIYLYRPSDWRLDFEIPLKLDSTGTQLIPTNQMVAGQWKLQIDWTADTSRYFNNKILMIQ